MTLHDAIIETLKTKGERVDIEVIASYINEHNLYVRPSDNMPVEGWQIKLRAISKEYKELFVVEECNDGTYLSLA